jgi:NADP-dependent 3-hydroxy acid dehydrogenase YdfG
MVSRMVQGAKSEMGPIDILVNNAGLSKGNDIHN